MHAHTSRLPRTVAVPAADSALTLAFLRRRNAADTGEDQMMMARAG